MSYGFYPPYQTSHVHRYSTITSFDFGHRHGIYGITGPTIRIGFGDHIHYMQGTTTFDDGHVHYYATYTGPAISTGPNTHTHRFNGITTINGRPPHTHGYSDLTAPAYDDVY